MSESNKNTIVSELLDDAQLEQIAGGSFPEIILTIAREQGPHILALYEQKGMDFFKEKFPKYFQN